MLEDHGTKQATEQKTTQLILSTTCFMFMLADKDDVTVVIF